MGRRVAPERAQWRRSPRNRCRRAPGGRPATIEDRRPTLSQQRPPIDRTSSRRERRAAARSGRAPVASPTKSSARRSPIVLLSGGALLVGAIVVVIALATTGQLGGSSTVLDPLSPIPDKSHWDGRALGPADAKVVVEVFEDFQCPACDVFSTQSQPQLVREFVDTGKIRFVYKDFAFLGPESLAASIAARCAGDQGLFWPYHEYLFANQKGENQGHFSKSFLTAIGAKVGVEPQKFSACLDSAAPKDATEAETAEGKKRGVAGTPTVFVNDENLGFPAYLDLKAKIEAALEAAGS